MENIILKRKFSQLFQFLISSFQNIQLQIYLSKPMLQTIEKYAFKLLKPTHCEATVNLLVNQFVNQNPLINAYYRSFPLQYRLRAQKERQFWSSFAQELTSNQMSVGCFDQENGGELIGINVAKDFNFKPKGFDEKFMKDFNLYSSIFLLQQAMIQQSDIKYRQILTQKKVVDFLAAAIKKNHTGKGLLSKMMKVNEQICRERGFDYSFGFITNFRTGVALKKINYQKFGEINVTSFSIDNKRPFQTVEQLTKYSSIWLKRINPPSSSDLNDAEFL